MTNMPDVARFRRLPVLLPPVTRAMDSPTPSKKSSSTTKKSAIKLDKSLSEKEKEKEDIARY